MCLSERSNNFYVVRSIVSKGSLFCFKITPKDLTLRPRIHTQCPSLTRHCIPWGIWNSCYLLSTHLSLSPQAGRLYHPRQTQVHLPQEIPLFLSPQSPRFPKGPLNLCSSSSFRGGPSPWTRAPLSLSLSLSLSLPLLWSLINLLASSWCFPLPSKMLQFFLSFKVNTEKLFV